jgi:two-component system phosphate regulon response regulator PhoB
MSGNKTVNPIVLVVEDEPAIATMIRYNLEKKSFVVHTTDDGEEALYLINEIKPDVVLLDWMLPGLTGLEVCARIRADDKNRALPVIMLTAKGEEHDRVYGLETGADDYIVKPFSPSELVARIHAVLRRIRPMFSSRVLEYRSLRYDLESHRVTRDGKAVHLGPTELKILQCLLEYPKRVFSREHIINKVWGFDSYVEPRTVDVHINRLRNGLKTSDEDENLVYTIRSAGYSLQHPDDIDL